MTLGAFGKFSHSALPLAWVLCRLIYVVALGNHHDLGILLLVVHNNKSNFMKNTSILHLIAFLIAFTFTPSYVYGQKGKKKAKSESKTLEQENAVHIEAGCTIMSIKADAITLRDSTGKITSKHFYFDTKELISRSEYYEDAAGEKHGEYKYWNRNKVLISHGHYQHGKSVGEWIAYQKDGKIKEVTQYKMLGGDTLQFDVYAATKELLRSGFIIGKKEEYTYKKPITTKNDPDTIYDFVDSNPVFPGGEAAMLQFLANEVNYPVIAQENNITGRQYVQCVVEPDGSLSNIECVRCAGQCFEDDLKRVLLKMPKWKPGLLKGEPVRVKYTIPVLFTLK
jgi:Gram-negative bacterial TonB protein C-terminal